MDTRVGLDYIMENSDYTQKLVTALDTDDIPVKKQVFELLSALCVYRPDGYVRALETLEHYKTLKKRRYRFQLVVDELKSSQVAEYTTTLVAFINCLIISAASFGERVRIRNEFLGLKLLEVLNRFREQCKDGSHPDLAVQLDVFDEQRSTDEVRFAGPDGVDLSSHMDVFFAILRQVAETPQEIPFLSILQHLLRTDLNQPLSELIWGTVETLVHRATLLESQQEADRLLRASNLGGQRCHCSCHHRPNSLVSEDTETTPGKKNRPNQLSFCPSEGSRTPATLLSPCDPTSSPLPSWISSKLPCQRHNLGVLSSGSQEVPSSEKACDDVLGSDNRVCAVDATITSKDCSNGIRTPNVPPPPPPPPPIGCPPPPPPLHSLPQTKQVSSDVTLPQTDTPKPKAKMKSFNWTKIPVSKVIGKDNLWSRVAKDHSGSPNDLDFEAMEVLFCQQPVSTSGHVSPRFGDPNDASDKRRKDIQEINLLDGKRSLNINIFLKQFRSSNESIVRILEEGAHEDLGAERLRGLLKILPESDEVDLLKNFDGDKTKLGSAEKFLLQLIEVPSYKLRVESMLLKEEFLSNQEFLENSIETIRCAAQELEECRKLHEVLYRVLVAGNFLNAGGYAGNAAGFKMLSLLKLTDIRANKPSVTLIHYVAEEVSKKRPDLLEFPEEIQNLEEASKISIETLKTDVSSLCQRVSKVSTQVTVADHQIKVQMQDFIEFAQSKMEGLQNEVNELESVRQRLADFLCEDAAAFKLEDCFKVFHSFCARFKAALQENERRQKQEQLAEARRKHREQQVALKRRSLELPDARSGPDPIMDELLGDIRSGFPERRLDRREPDDRLKRHSDPAMLDKCVELDDRLGSFKSRRARFLDLQNKEDAKEDCLERVSFRRSGRRKRAGIENGDATQSRERPGSSPPPQEALSIVEPESDPKQRLRSKINDWMLQNEKEQKRERDLQLKLLQERKKRLSSGQLMNGDVSNVEGNVLEEIEERESKQVAPKPHSDLVKNNPSLDDAGDFKMARGASSRRSASFTQKIIGLIDATSNGSFAKTRLYSSTRETGAVREGLENKSSKVYTGHAGQPSWSEDLDASKKPDCDFEHGQPSWSEDQDASKKPDSDFEKAQKSWSKDQDAPKKPESNFDRFAPTRKTQRRLKLREMRIEAESIKATKQEERSLDSEALMPESPLQTDEGSSSIQNKTSEDSVSFADRNSAVSPERKESSAGVVETDRGCTDSDQRLETKESCANETMARKEGTPFSRSKNTSLRSRQSRLARRINSLSTPVASPESTGSSPSVSESDERKNKPADSDLRLKANDGIKPSEKSSSGSFPIDDEVSREPNHAEIKPPKATAAAATANGHLSHKVTVNTETKSKVVISKSGQNSQAASSTKSRVPLQKAATNIPGVVKTTRNVRVQQTVQKEGLANGRTITQKTDINRKRVPPVQSKTSCSVKGQSSIKQTRIGDLTNGETHGSKNGNPAPSVSSLCNMNTNVKLIKNERTNANKITIQHNGSVKFMKNNVSVDKPTSSSNSAPKNEKKPATRRKGFVY